MRFSSIFITKPILLIMLVVIISVTLFFTMQQSYETAAVSHPDIVRVAVLPDESKEALHQRYDSLLAHLTAQTGIQFQLTIPADYADLLHQFETHKADMGYFGGLTFIRANKSVGIEPLVTRDIDINFTSWFITKVDEADKQLLDFKNASFVFGSELSTSGHLMPRYYLQQEKKLIPEQFFNKISYSGAHDKTAYLVRDGIADIGVINPEVFNSMIRDGRLRKNTLRVVWETPPYIDYVWAVQNDMNKGTRNRIRDAFLLLEPGNIEHRTILHRLGAEAFFPVGLSDFRILQHVARDVGLLDIQN